MHMIFEIIVGQKFGQRIFCSFERKCRTKVGEPQNSYGPYKARGHQAYAAFAMWQFRQRELVPDGRV